MDREVIDLYLDDIIPNRFQPREIFDERALRELSDSIREHGVIQPIIVRKIGDKYEIIAGERRYKASAMAGLTRIPAIVRNLDDKETSKVALLENLQRRDLTAIEEARTYHKILELDSLTQEELGKTMGKSQAAIANKLRLLALPDEVQEALLNDQISERHARSLLNFPTSQDQIDMLHKIIMNRMTVRELDSEIRAKLGPSKNITASTVVNVDQLKQQSEDIIRPIRQMANLDDLLKADLPETAEEVGDSYRFVPNTEDAPIVQVPTVNNSIDFNEIPFVPTKPIVIESFDQSQTPYQPFTNTKSFITEFKDQQIPGISENENFTNSNGPLHLNDAIGQLKNAINMLEQNGFSIKTEETDLENSYQIVIKLEKNN